ncbi:MAG: rhodanese-like domain-containing protein [Bacteroidales bacterium]|nr:rhodanese-like domain-containing protein [Bacteroidales bacterium]MDZ4205572.1 rhodanese-like domain-containing protein [Bacteroidales bacterium]
MKIITPTELKALLDAQGDVQIIDIRDPEAYAAGHIAGSLLIPKMEIPNKVEDISRSAKVVICCAYGMKSDQVVIYLQEKHKFKNVWLLDGGLYEYARDFNPSMQVL